MLIVIHLHARYQPLGVMIVDWDMAVNWGVWTILLFHCHCLHYFPLLYLIAEDDQTSLSTSALGLASDACAPFHFNNNSHLLTPVVLHQQQAHTPNHWCPPPLIAPPPLATSLLSSGWLLCCILLHHCLPSADASAPPPLMSASVSASHSLASLPLVVPLPLAAPLLFSGWLLVVVHHCCPPPRPQCHHLGSSMTTKVMRGDCHHPYCCWSIIIINCQHLQSPQQDLGSLPQKPGSICCLGCCLSLPHLLHLHWLVIASHIVASCLPLPFSCPLVLLSSHPCSL
jgi:hypothetical protein